MKNFNLKIGEIEIEVLKFKIEETEIVVKCRNKNTTWTVSISEKI